MNLHTMTFGLFEAFFTGTGCAVSIRAQSLNLSLGALVLRDVNF